MGFPPVIYLLFLATVIASAASSLLRFIQYAYELPPFETHAIASFVYTWMPAQQGIALNEVFRYNKYYKYSMKIPAQPLRTTYVELVVRVSDIRVRGVGKRLLSMAPSYIVICAVLYPWLCGKHQQCKTIICIRMPLVYCIVVVHCTPYPGPYTSGYPNTTHMTVML